LNPGDLVGVHARSGPRLAVITAIQGSKASLSIGFEARSERCHLRELDLIAPGPTAPGSNAPGSLAPCSLTGAPWLFSHDLLSQANPSRRDLAAAWLLLEHDTSWLSLKAFTELLLPQADALHLAATWLLLQQQDLFRWKQGQVQPRSLQDLRNLRRERHAAELRQQQVQQWHQTLAQRLPLQREALPAEARQQLEALLRFATDPEQGLTPALRQLLHDIHCPPELGDVRRLLADLGQWQRHQLRCLEGTTWSAGFPAELEREAQQLVEAADQVQPSDASRLDLTHQRSVTIDDADTRDVDDGLALERCPDGSRWIWIHVADPGRLVAADSPLDLEARRRASSLYLAQGNVPMFPTCLSEGVFSLEQGRPCASWSIAVRLDAEGAIAERRVHRSWIQPRYRLSYEDADELIEYAPPQDDDLNELHGLLEQRRRWRVAHGALLMDQPEGRFRRSGDQAELEVVEPSPSRLMVAEAMILAGAAVAELAREEGLALPFRSQPGCSLPPAAELQALPPGPVRHAALRKGLSRGITGHQPAPHFSLGLEAYVQATSPIRRYGDLLAQRQLAALLDGANPLPGEQVAALLEQLEPALRQGIQISREDQRHWQQVWFAQHRSERWDGLLLRWLRPQDGLALVRLEALAMDLAVVIHGGGNPGEAVLVQVKESDPDADVLRLVGQRLVSQT
jgi:exoribonuclease-2